MSWKGTDDYKVMSTGFPTGDLSAYTKISFIITSITGDNDYVQLKVCSEGKSDKMINLTNGVNNIVLLNYDDINWTNVTELTLWGTGSSDGSAVIADAYLQKPTDVVTGSFGDEITTLAGITDGTKFVIANTNATKAMYFVSNSVDSKNSTINNVPNDGYYYYQVTKIDGLDTDGDSNTEDDNYTVQVFNSAGTIFPNPWWSGGSYLNYSMYGYTFAATAASGVNQNYGWDFAYGGIWKISHEESGFVFQCAGKKEANNPYVYLKVDGTQAVSSGKVYLKLYKSLDINVNSEIDATADENVNITVGGETRNYQLYVPEQVQENCPLVISLHGAGGASTNYSPFKKAVADAEGCIVAYPQGKVTSFPVLGNSNTGWTASGDNNFDVKFLKAVIEDVASKYQIDRKRIYCCGFSNGGMMTYALSNTCSDVFAAFASISGYPINEFHLRHTGSRPVPFMHIHGKADDFVLYEKMPTIVDEMVARLGANPVPTTTTTTTSDVYTKNVYQAADGSFPYVYYEIDGMGHVDYTDKTEDGNSAQTMWNFFEQYTLDSQCDETLKWAPRIEEEGYTPAEHGWTVNSGTTLLSFGGDQYTTNNKNVYRSLQFSNGQYKLNFKSAGDAGKTINVKIVKLTSPYTAILNANVNAGEDAELPFEVTDGWGEYKLTMTRPTADDVITVTDITVTKTGEASSVQAEIQNKVILTGGKFAECFTPGTYIIEMQGWQSFVAYEDAEGVAINDNSTMVFDMAESCSNGSVRVTFTFSDGSTRQEWWCLGIGTSADDASTPYGHAFDNSTYWLKKGLSAVWNDKKELKITKVTIENFGTDDVFTFKVNGGTICGQPMTIKQSNAKTFGAYGGEFSATSAQTNIFQIKNFATGDYKKMVIKFSEAVPNTGGWHLNNNSGLKALSGKTEYEFALDGTPISDFTIFNMNANPDPIKISEVYLYKEEEVEVLLAFDEYGVATTDKADLRATGGLSYNPETGGLTTNGKAGTLELKFTNPVNLNYLNKFTVNRSGNDAIIDNVKFYDADDAEINTWNNSKLQNDGLDNNATKAFINHNPVKKLVWSSAAGKSTDLTLTITGITWQLKTMSCVNAGETVLNTLPWNKIDGSGTATPDWNMHTTTDTYYGDYSGNATHYVDLTAYSELRVYRDNNDPCRAFFINAAGTGTNQVNTGSATWNAEKKYWSFDLSTVEKWNNKVALKCIKANSGVNNLTVNNIVVYKTPGANAPKYVLAGSGMQLAETVAALADATATSIDATGVTALTTDQNYAAGKIELTSANPNCLFLATANQLSNTENVIVNGTCASLVLTDGYPFKAPSDFTATAATYTTTISPAAQAGTLCLPFAATFPQDVTAYTLTYQSGDNATATEVETTIPANTPVLLNGSGEVTFTGSGAVSASATNVSGALKGVFETGTVPEGSYVLQKKDNKLGFFKVGSTPINIKPFRAYLTAQAGARLGITFADETTGIETSDNLTISPVDHPVYNLKGQRIGQPTKGLYIVNSKKVVIK